MARKYKKRTAKEKKPSISDALKAQFIHFMEYHPAQRFSRNLRRMLLEHLMHDSPTESVYLYETLMDLDGLFDLLDVIQSEWKPNIKS